MSNEKEMVKADVATEQTTPQEGGWVLLSKDDLELVGGGQDLVSTI